MSWRGRSLARSRAVTTNPAASRTGSGSGFMRLVSLTRPADPTRAVRVAGADPRVVRSGGAQGLSTEPRRAYGLGRPGGAVGTGRTARLGSGLGRPGGCYGHRSNRAPGLRSRATRWVYGHRSNRDEAN